MKTYIAISLVNGHNNRLHELTDVLNRLICTPVKKSINVYDLTGGNMGSLIKALLRSYARFGVVVHKVKRPFATCNERINFSIAQSLMDFNIIHSKRYDSYVHINQNLCFQNFDLQILIDNCKFYNAISPVIESINGLEIWDAVFDRYGVTYSQNSNYPTFMITGQVEESYTLNPKCFALSNRYAKTLKNFTISEREPVEYLNNLIYQNTDILPKIDNTLFVHENLY